ncbi:adenosylcobinamide-phosphate synthase CbiB [Amaricoccus solimangrovi]|uniref:Cobalamin biosynthesis protein CobD n=1 Tax=Amaricoccus solimangrovi TaxID=2589815 RepID=A0A501WN50_9RHOB|nr:adenosylcobinamide-phosphate synthase CbiB [Amaricoccus solimangrovi]TPE49770.1 cobalamin biosynthesis protein CobD [Amaricoccus solimangrovi]
MIVGLGVDAALGWPDGLFARIGHPVTWLGRLIGALDRRWNRGAPWRRRLAGIAAALTVIAAAALPAVALDRLLPGGWPGAVLTGLLAWPLIALRSLRDHVAAVAGPLAAGDLPEARRRVALIVGRDPAKLDLAGVARAAIESLAENASDGVVAPVFWGALFGLPGIAGYKAINTLDSMIGHRTPRHETFGWASARIDDLANLAPARLTGLLVALAAPRPGRSLAVMWRDAGRHRSPNAGWPEAAMAGALGIRLSGPRIYADRRAEEPWLNEGARDPGAAEIVAALRLARRAALLLVLGLAGLAILA